MPGLPALHAVISAAGSADCGNQIYDQPYENPAVRTEYPGFVQEGEQIVTDTITLNNAMAQALFTMTPYYFNTPPEGAARLAACPELATEIGFRFLLYRRENT